MISSGGISDLNTIGLDAYANVTDNAGTPEITKSSSNVSSITDRAVGRYTIVFGTALASANYSALVMCNGINNDEYQDTTPAKSATAFPIAFYLVPSYRDSSFYFAAFGA